MDGAGSMNYGLQGAGGSPKVPGDLIYAMGFGEVPARTTPIQRVYVIRVTTTRDAPWARRTCPAVACSDRVGPA
jgi:hypothetical protein